MFLSQIRRKNDKNFANDEDCARMASFYSEARQ